MSATPNLGLPYIDAGQAQKHVTHNEALRYLDTLVQLAVLDRDLTTPPSSPAEGQRWIVKTGATGAWSGHTDHIAAWQDGAWQFSAPVAGWVAYVIDEEVLAAWDGDSWNAVSAGEGGGGSDPTELQDMTLLGIGTTADVTNPVSAKLNNVLWTAQTVAEGGDGTLRYKLSKESAAKTLSFLLQDNFVGCAEIGLTGDDDFHFKVSPDGTSWLEGIKIDRATGKVSFPVSGGPRELLTANRTYYVRTDGSDGNKGLANTSGGAFLTIQKALNVVYGTLDLAGFNVTIQVGAGTYTGLIAQTSPQVGAGTVLLQGDTTTPSNVLISTTTTSLNLSNGAVLQIAGFKITASTGGCIQVAGGGTALTIAGNMEFGAVGSGQRHIIVSSNSLLTIGANYTISAGAQNHVLADRNSVVECNGRTRTLTGTPAWAGAFIDVQLGAAVRDFSGTFSGSSTGPRYAVSLNGTIQTFGGGASYFPGNAAGSSATGGQYA